MCSVLFVKPTGLNITKSFMLDSFYSFAHSRSSLLPVMVASFLFESHRDAEDRALLASIPDSKALYLL